VLATEAFPFDCVTPGLEIDFTVVDDLTGVWDELEDVACCPVVTLPEQADIRALAIADDVMVACSVAVLFTT
jgi:hypothetical protein